MAWYFLIFSAICEAFYNLALKRIRAWNDFTNIALAALLLAFGLLGFKKGINSIQMSIAVVAWSGVSLLVTIVLDIIFYKTRFDLRTAFFMCLCIGSIIGLNFSSKQ
jgi:multidrug transporter EmrE-like cation transporter